MVNFEIEARCDFTSMLRWTVSWWSEQMPEWYWYLNARRRSNAESRFLLVFFLVVLDVLMERLSRYLEHVDAVLHLC